jgi:hypothetical protein
MGTYRKNYEAQKKLCNSYKRNGVWQTKQCVKRNIWGVGMSGKPAESGLEFKISEAYVILIKYV